MTRYLTARARVYSCESAAEQHEFMIEADGTVSVYAEIAGHYTTCHSMTPRTIARIRRLAQDFGRAEPDSDSPRC